MSVSERFVKTQEEIAEEQIAHQAQAIRDLFLGFFSTERNPKHDCSALYSVNRETANPRVTDPAVATFLQGMQMEVDYFNTVEPAVSLPLDGITTYTDIEDRVIATGKWSNFEFSVVSQLIRHEDGDWSTELILIKEGRLNLPGHNGNGSSN